MTDEKFVFNQDVKERSKMKTGAMHKKNGSKSKKCTFPSDYLTAKEKKKLNGTCVSIKLNEPFRDWKAFRHLPDTMQAEYIQHLVDNYDGSQRSIAEMLGTNQTNFSSYLKRRQLHITFRARGGARNIKSQRFEEFLNRGPKKTDEEIINERFEIEFKEEKKMETKPMFEGVSKLNITMTASKEAILNIIASSLGEGADYVASLDFMKVDAFPKNIEAQYTTCHRTSRGLLQDPLV